MKKIEAEAGLFLCHRCNRVTRWVPMRGARVKCEGCGDVFPCHHTCAHADCAIARGAKRAELPNGLIVSEVS